MAITNLGDWDQGDVIPIRLQLTDPTTSTPIDPTALEIVITNQRTRRVTSATYDGTGTTFIKNGTGDYTYMFDTSSSYGSHRGYYRAPSGDPVQFTEQFLLNVIALYSQPAS